MLKRKYSRKRELILDKIKSSACHPTADWLFTELRNDNHDISLDTIYRNLRLFKDEGIITSLGIINGQEHFETTDIWHGHFICKTCNIVKDIDLDNITNSFTNVANIQAAQVDKVDLTVHGICDDCM